MTLKGRSRDRLGKRQRQGKGQGPSREGSGEGETAWAEWADENLPDLPADLVCMSASRLSGSGHDISPERVRQQVLASYPHLAEEAA